MTVISPTEFIAEPDAVMLDLEAESGEAAVYALHGRLVASTDAIRDPDRFRYELFDRMRLAPVCIAKDVALPHARTSCVSQLVLAVARAKTWIRFDAEHPQVRFLFLIGTPKDAVHEYLRAVAALSRLLRNRVTLAGLHGAADEAEFRAVLAGGVAALR